eukprot:4099116-Pleurochrysis_carterae.AAC.1
MQKGRGSARLSQRSVHVPREVLGTMRWSICETSSAKAVKKEEIRGEGQEDIVKKRIHLHAAKHSLPTHTIPPFRLTADHASPARATRAAGRRHGNQSAPQIRGLLARM